jgi:hypothetical protein
MFSFSHGLRNHRALLTIQAMMAFKKGFDDER